MTDHEVAESVSGKLLDTFGVTRGGGMVAPYEVREGKSRVGDHTRALIVSGDTGNGLTLELELREDEPTAVVIEAFGSKQPIDDAPFVRKAVSTALRAARVGEAVIVSNQLSAELLAQVCTSRSIELVTTAQDPA